MAQRLTTERLILRRFESGDAERLVELDGDPAVLRWINGGLPTPRSVVESRILPLFCTYDENLPLHGFWAAESGADPRFATGVFLGWFAFRATEEGPHHVSLGFRLSRTAWGRGYATEGARFLIESGFAHAGVRRVIATTYERNLASRRVLEKLGMRLERTFRYTEADLDGTDTVAVQDGVVWDGSDLEYALERADWLARR